MAKNVEKDVSGVRVSGGIAGEIARVQPKSDMRFLVDAAKAGEWAEVRLDAERALSPGVRAHAIHLLAENNKFDVLGGIIFENKSRFEDVPRLACMKIREAGTEAVKGASSGESLEMLARYGKKEMELAAIEEALSRGWVYTARKISEGARDEEGRMRLASSAAERGIKLES